MNAKIMYLTMRDLIR